ncbi:MAG: hypothetical protein H8D43_03455 [Chloroflexi bacterium]|nr:hypothetical protein [Chloroflexota bacterium]
MVSPTPDGNGIGRAKTVDKTTLAFKEFQLALGHVEKLLDRRQANTSFYLFVNTGILAAIGLLIKDSGLTQEWLLVAILLLVVAGLIACWIWRSLLHQYEILLDWWYAHLRELEDTIPGSAKLVTREYEGLYVGAEDRKPSERIGMTKRELLLNWVFIGLYAAFAIGIVWNSLL